MKIVIMYESKFSNGKKLVEELEEILKGKGQDVEIYSVRDIKPANLPSANIYVFSSPARIGMLPRNMKSFIRKFRLAKEGAKYALMTTYLVPGAKALESMEKLIEPKKMIKAADDFKVKVMDMKGPVEEGYREKLEKFADELVK